METRKRILISLSLMFILGLFLWGCNQADGENTNSDLNGETDNHAEEGTQKNESETEEGVEEGQAEEETTENGTNRTGETDGLQITTSFSVLSDIIAQVIGERGSVEYVVPIGEEPHEYEPVPSDFQAVEDSDVFFVNGLDLEEWLETLMGNVSETPIVEVSEGVTPIPLSGEEGTDPHAWLAPKYTETYVHNIVDYLVEVDPEGESEYKANAEAFIAELEELDRWIEQEVEQIPEEHRFIAISENAFKYFGEAYGFETDGVWEINSHEEGTPQQIARLVEVIQERDVPAVFVETTVSRSYMETVSNDSGVEIAGEVHTDALGEEGTETDHYLGMIRHNAETFIEGLSQ